MSWRAVLLVCFALIGCSKPSGSASMSNESARAQTLKTGADLLVEERFASLQGLRVGLIANQTSQSGGRHLADLLHEAGNVDLAALFGPEHGLRGEADAGLAVEDGVDDGTGVPIYSLYGSRRAPEQEVLRKLDILVFDIQDVGARFYTYIATMGLSMEAAAEAGIPFLVLDRPNPLGGNQVDGFVLEAGFESFVGPFPIPVQHGMTVGELAGMIQDKGWYPGLSDLDLRVLRMEGWSRDQRWPASGREWVPTSPNIPDFVTALVYPGMCLLEATSLNEGRGTASPFMVFGSPDLDAVNVSRQLSESGLEGVSFRPITYTPVSIPGKSTDPRYRDTPVQGVSIEVTDMEALRPLALGVMVMEAVTRDQGPDVLRKSGLARLGGTDRLWSQLTSGATGSQIVESWAEEVAAFRQARKPYLLYP